MQASHSKFSADAYERVYALPRDEAEQMLQRRRPNVAAAILRTWPADTRPAGLALAALLDVLHEVYQQQTTEPQGQSERPLLACLNEIPF